MSEFCSHKKTETGTSCKRCGCWWADSEPIICPPFITRSEPDGKRLPDITTKAENNRRYRAYIDEKTAKPSVDHSYPTDP